MKAIIRNRFKLSDFGYYSADVVNLEANFRLLKVGEILRLGDIYRTKFGENSLAWIELNCDNSDMVKDYPIPAYVDGFYLRQLPQDWVCRSPACAKTTSPVGSPCWKCGRAQSSS